VESEPVLFEGDNYSDAWKKEAARRGLSNIVSVPESLTKYLSEKSKKVLIGNKIFSEKELEGRVEVEFEKFTKKIQIEARVLGDLAKNHIIPTALQYQNTLISNVTGLKEIFPEAEFKKLAGARKELIKEISEHISTIKKLVAEMIEARKVANRLEDMREMAFQYDREVRPYLDRIRYHIDKLELTVDNEMWSLPKYRELLFTR
jgi:glutamine synthetase